MNILKIHTLVAVNILMVSNLLFSQEVTIKLLDGKNILAQEYTIDAPESEDGMLLYKNAGGKQREKYLDDVFSIIENGSETIMYKQNIAIGNILTPEQMKMYLVGLNDVLENYKVPGWVFGGGVASGLIGGVLPQPNVDFGSVEGSLPLGVLVPVAYVGAIGFSNPDNAKFEKYLPNYCNDEYYLIGVESGVQKKRIKKGLIGSAVGFVAGFITILAINETFITFYFKN